MRNRLTKLALTGILVAGVMHATEFRSPWLSERGPLRYKFEKGNPDRYSLDVYSFAHRREAHKAFLSHGTSTKPLTALFFNKADIRLNEIFHNSTMDVDSLYYNPFMNYMIIHPRATYYEWGTNVGCRFEYPVYKDKGRIGLRVNVPFRLIEIERENITDKLDDQIENYILARHAQVETGINSGGTANILAKAYNLGFVGELMYLGAGGVRKKALTFEATKVNVFGQNVANDWLLADANAKKLNQLGSPVAGAIYTAANSKIPAEPSDKQKWAFNAGDTQTNITQQQRKDHAIPGTGAAPAGIGNAPNIIKGIGFFTTQDETPANLTYNIGADQLAQMWLVLGYANGILTPGARNIADGIENAVAVYVEDPYEWLLNRGGYELETYRRTGFGDIDLDIFYEHMFSEKWIAEIMLGVRFPTGWDDDYALNPYKPHLGNGEHWEIKLGGMVAWQPLDWMNVKLDPYISFVLEAKEKRCAAFEGAKIKNMGPAVDADVDWIYVVARLDMNFFHPKNKNISGLLGYEFYYKTEDDVSFKKSQMTGWEGVHYRDPDLLEKPLSNKLAEANTEAIGHKIRAEGRYQFNEWFEMMAGGSYTFAGKNLPRETDLHAGCNVRF